MIARATVNARLLALLVVVGSGLLGYATEASAVPAVGGHVQARAGAALSGVQVVSADPSPGHSIVSPDGVMRIPRGTTVVPDRVLVRYRTGTDAAMRTTARGDIEATVATAYHLVPRLELLDLPPGESVAEAVTALSRDPSVEYAVPDVAAKVTATPNDPKYSSQWALSAMGAPAAWDRSTGSSTVTVAVLDTGVALNHPDLAANLVPGWNFVNNTSDPSDDYGHGTHVAGIIGAAGDNGVGVAGINWHVSIMPLKICDARGSCSLDEEVSALQYAVAHGAKIANASFGGYYGGYQPEEDAIAAAGRAGLLYVAAAGNASLNNDVSPFFPASYPLDNIISVAATTSSGGLASFSNYGFNSVSIGAPGERILSTMLTSGPLSSASGYGTLSGTSMAAPEVTGAAALLWAEHPDWTMQQIRMRLLTTATPLASLTGNAADCGQLNVAAATDPTSAERAIVCVRMRGSGGGSVASDSDAIDCAAVCVASVPVGSSVTLSATPSPGSTFAGWAGACSGSSPCTVSASGLLDVTATFVAQAGSPGWQQMRLPPPGGRDPSLPASAVAGTFYNVAVSADGSERAQTIFNPPAGVCAYDSADTGGVFLERRTATGWVDDGEVTAPRVPAYDGDPVARWANCSNYGTVTQLSADGTTLLVAPDMTGVWDPGPSGSHYRCAAYVYRRGDSGWTLASTLYPPGVDARGSITWDGCGYFGIEGALSDDGNRVAMLTAGLDGFGKTVLRADVYVGSQDSWSLEQQVTLPSPDADCGHTIGPRYLSLSGDGATMLVGSPDCDDEGLTAAGLVYAYERSDSQWTIAQTIHSPQPAESQSFGRETALSEDGNTAVIGSNNADGVSTWIFERGEDGWQMSTVLPHPNPAYPRGFACPTIVEHGALIICGAFDDVGFNPTQGALYIYSRPAGGWPSTRPQPREAFANDGLASDRLGQGDVTGWMTLAAPESGSFIDAPISPGGLASGGVHDRIGYEFTTDSTDKTLTTTIAGSGSGSITSDPVGIDCGSICWADFADSTSATFTLTATPETGSTFTGWTGACTGTGPCTVSTEESQSVTATFTLVSEALSVTSGGNGSGRVISSPVGISCATACSTTFDYGTTVTLTATPATDSAFSGWSGACTGTAVCTLSMSQAQSATATFSPAPETLTLARSGSGSGSVSSSPAGISCGTTCSTTFARGRTVTLTATPAAGSTFSGWSGACTGTTACSLTMDQTQSAVANFTRALQTLTVARSGNGTGRVTSTPIGISCGRTCSRNFSYGKKVTLTATPATGSRFNGWTGDCTGTVTCVVSMSQARSVAAMFTLRANTGSARRAPDERVRIGLGTRALYRTWRRGRFLLIGPDASALVVHRRLVAL